MYCKIKLLYIIIVISYFNTNLKSQKFDFNWIFGYDFSDNPVDTIEGINILEFNTPSGNPLVSYNPYIKSDFHNYGCSISDRNGNFLFCFDGYNVEDYRYNYITNSRKVCPDGDCEFLMQGSTIIPKPGNDSAYYLLHEQDELLFIDTSVSLMANFFNYSELDETGNHKGIVLKLIKKNVLNDTLDVGKVAYCKHANGRDWWALVPGRFSNKYYTLLIDPTGVKLNKIQEVGHTRNYGDGFACFSPNGNYYVIGTKDAQDEFSGSEFDFYHFDRASGILSNHLNIKIDSTESVSVGCAFSPSNEILYICSGQVLYQYPLENGQLKDRIEIATYDGYLSHLFDNNYGPTYFGQLQLGPDGRIYCNSNFIQTRHLHVINRPNNLGQACDFKQHAIPFFSIKKTMPYYPNYRLGPIDDSVSDTLGINNVPWCMWRYEQDSVNPLKFEFTDNSAYNPKEWKWNFDNNYISNQQNPMHTFQRNGIYNVCLIVTNEYGVDTLCRTIQIGTVSTSDYSEKINITLLPNPFSDYLILNIPEYSPEKMKVEIYDFNGKKVCSTKMLQGSNIIHTDEFVSGVYLLKFYELNRLVDLRVVVKL